MNRKERRRISADRDKAIVKNAVPVGFSKEDVNYDEREYENRIAQAHELNPQFIHGISGPDIEESDGIDRHGMPIDTEEDI